MFENIPSKKIFLGSRSLKFSTSSPSKMSSTGSSSTLSSSLDCDKFWLADHYLQNYLQSLSSILKQNGFSAEDTKRYLNITLPVDVQTRD